jgi:hypothetical protein
MSNYQQIIYPIRRTDGLITTGGDTIVPTDPVLTGMTVGGQLLSINGVDYLWPTSSGEPDTFLTTDGSLNLSWSTILGFGASDKITDFDNNTYINVDILGTGADDTIRYVTDNIEMQTITEELTKLTNSMNVSEETVAKSLNPDMRPGSSIGLARFIDNYIIDVGTGDIEFGDVTNPLVYNPVSTTDFTAVGGSGAGSANTTGASYGLYQWVAQQNSGGGQTVIIFDKSDPSLIVGVNTIACERVTDVPILNSFIFTFCGQLPETLKVYDISDVNNLLEIDSFTISPSSFFVGHKAVVKDNIMFNIFSTGTIQYVQSFDISDPYNIIVLDTFNLPSVSNALYTPLIVIGNYGFSFRTIFGGVAQPAIFISVNLSDPRNITLADNFDTGISPDNGGGPDCIVVGRYAYAAVVTALDKRNWLFDVSDPNNIVALDLSVQIPIDGRWVASSIAANNYIYRRYQSLTATGHRQLVVEYNNGYVQSVQSGTTTSVGMNVDGSVMSQNVICEGDLLCTAGFLITNDFTTNGTIRLINGELITKGLQNYPLRSSSQTTIELDQDHFINAINNTASIINLPPIDDTRNGTTFYINKVTTDNITLTANGANVIWDGTSDATTKILTSINTNEITEVFCNGTKWFIV